MHIRPCTPADVLALASIKANCDLSDPLALYSRRLGDVSTELQQQRQQHGHQHQQQWQQWQLQWKAHIHSLRRSLELELLIPGTACWVVVLDDDDHNDHRDVYSSQGTGEEEGNYAEKVVGFAIWNRHGSSHAARKWKAEGHKLSTRLRFLLTYTHLLLTYPFDTSIHHTRMTKFQHRLRSAQLPYSSVSASENFLMAEPKRERWELEALYIHPRFQRRGYGAEALRWGIEVARREGVEVWVWSTAAGKRLYLKSGFAVVRKICFGDLIAKAAVGRVVEDGGYEAGDDDAGVWIMVRKPPPAS